MTYGPKAVILISGFAVAAPFNLQDSTLLCLKWAATEKLVGVSLLSLCVLFLDYCLCHGALSFWTTLQVSRSDK